MSEDPLKDIRIAEENKKKTLAKREEQKNTKVKKARIEEEKKLQEKKEELINEIKKELVDVKKTESEKVKNKLAAEKEKIEAFTKKIQEGEKLSRAINEVFDAFLSAK